MSYSFSRPVFRFPIPSLNQQSQDILKISFSAADRDPYEIATHEGGHTLANLALGKPVHTIILQPFSVVAGNRVLQNEADNSGIVLSSPTRNPLKRMVQVLGGEASNQLFTSDHDAKLSLTEGSSNDMLKVLTCFKRINGNGLYEGDRFLREVEKNLTSRDSNDVIQGIRQTLVLPVVSELYEGLQATFKQTNGNNGITHFFKALAKAEPMIGTPEAMYFIGKNFGLSNWSLLRKASKQHLLPLLQKYKLK